MKKKYYILKIITVITLSIQLCGCSNTKNNSNITEQRVIPEQSDLFVAVETKNMNQNSGFTEQDIQEQKEAKIIANDLLNANTEVSNQLRKDYELNQEEALNLNIEEYSWYIREDTDEFQDNGHKYVIFALLNYFNYNITENVYCKLPDDVTEMPTGSLFNIRVRLESGNTIDCYIDLFSNKIQITENNK